MDPEQEQGCVALILWAVLAVVVIGVLLSVVVW